MPKHELIERSRIMFEECYPGMDSLPLYFDLLEFGYDACVAIHDSLTKLYENCTGESADA